MGSRSSSRNRRRVIARSRRIGSQVEKEKEEKGGDPKENEEAEPEEEERKEAQEREEERKEEQEREGEDWTEQQEEEEGDQEGEREEREEEEEKKKQGKDMKDENEEEETITPRLDKSGEMARATTSQWVALPANANTHASGHSLFFLFFCELEVDVAFCQYELSSTGNMAVRIFSYYCFVFLCFFS